jgi:hypothetical protein
MHITKLEHTILAVCSSYPNQLRSTQQYMEYIP